MYVCYIGKHAYMHNTYTDICICLQIHLWLPIYIPTYIHSYSIYTHPYIHTCVCMYTI